VVCADPAQPPGRAKLSIKTAIKDDGSNQSFEERPSVLMTCAVADPGLGQPLT
jgi:hypothetical protein